MNIDIFLENSKHKSFKSSRKTLLSIRNRLIEKEAKRIQREITKEREKDEKLKNKILTGQEKAAHSSKKKNVLHSLKTLKSLTKNRSSLLAIIQDLEVLGMKVQTANFIKSVAPFLDKFATSSDKQGTRLVTRNHVLIKRIVHHPIVKDHPNPSVKNIVSKIVRIGDPGLNPRLEGMSKIEILRHTNNVLFNNIKDLIFELAKKDILEREGVD